VNEVQFGTKLKAILSAVAGLIFAFIGIIGSFGCPCAFPILGAIFGILGISSISLARFNILFLFVGVALLLLAFFYLLKSVRDKNAQ
jgi:hypothetical protein